MRTWSITFLLIAVTLAGCAEGTTPTATDDEAKFQDIEITDDKGIIRGLVLDPTITPIEGATVTLKGREVATLSNADGAFVFTDLEPGTYFLEVGRLGYSSTQTSVTVEAGIKAPPIVKVQLVPDATSLPFIQQFQFDGFIQCSTVSIVVGAAVCSFPGLVGVDIGDDFLVRYETSGYPDHIQGEMVWDSTQPLGDSLNFQIWDGTTSSPLSNTGPSPRIISENRSFWESGEGSRKSGSPMVTPGEEFAWRVFAGGLEGTDHCDTIPACVGGVGVTLQQSFTVYTNVFYRFVPDETWLFIEDGAHPIPT